MVTIGGGVGAALWTATDAQRAVELWDPATDRWRTGPAQQEFRAYHSTAVLLPDGRVLSAGDDVNTSSDPVTGQPRNGNLADTAEIYSPPYLSGARGRRSLSRPSRSSSAAASRSATRCPTAGAPCSGPCWLRHPR